MPLETILEKRLIFQSRRGVEKFDDGFLSHDGENQALVMLNVDEVAA